MKEKTCDECKGRIIKKKVDYMLLGESLGKFPAEVCTKCGEEVFDESVMESIDKAAREKGLWGMEAKTKIGKVGNSFNILINKKIADFLKLKKGEEVTLFPESRKRLVISIH